MIKNSVVCLGWWKVSRAVYNFPSLKKTARRCAGSFFTTKMLMRPPSIVPPSAQQTAATMPSLRADSPRSNPSNTKNLKWFYKHHHATDLTAPSMDFHLQCLYEYRFFAHRTHPRRTRHRTLLTQSSRGLRVGARQSNHWTRLYPSRRSSTRRGHGDTRCASTQARHHGRNCVCHA